MSDTNKKHLFVAMPYGEREACLDNRQAGNSIKINFNAVWEGILSPAIPEDFIAKRADELQESGIIDQIYIEWLLEADVVLADLTFGNPNVYYELGIRQALSKKGTVLVAQLGTALPFDVASQSVLNYDCFNAASLNKFQKNLKSRILNAALHKKDSPVHIFLPGLFVRRYEASETPELIITKLENQVALLEAELSSFKNRASVDRLLRKIDDASEPSSLITLYNQIIAKRILSLEVLETLAVRLRKFGMLKEAITILDIAHDCDPQDSDILRELGFCYRKMGEDYYERAYEYFLAALKINDSDPELHGMIGGMLKRQGEYEKAMEHYCKAHSLIRDDIYSLVNLGAISTILNLTEDAKKYYRDVLNFCEQKIANGTADYWTYLCQGEAAVIIGDEILSKQAYKGALELKPPIEDVRSSSEQLEFFLSLGYQSSIAVKIQDILLKPYLVN